MPLPMVLNICQFKRNGEMEYGEFQELSNGEGVCMIPSVDDPEEVVFVHDAAGHVPDGITDFMLTPVPCSINDVHDGHLEITPEIEERMSRTNLILEEYETGVLDETEAGEQLFNHLFGSGLGRGNN